MGSDHKPTSMRAWDLFQYRQIYPGDKKTHLKRIKKSSGVDFEDIVFFDDESRNSNVESLGVCFWLVRDGVNRSEVDKGIHEWRKRQHGIAKPR
jgi:magnesium-dependent phosphatase 1